MIGLFIPFRNWSVVVLKWSRVPGHCWILTSPWNFFYLSFSIWCALFDCQSMSGEIVGYNYIYWFYGSNFYLSKFFKISFLIFSKLSNLNIFVDSKIYSKCFNVGGPGQLWIWTWPWHTALPVYYLTGWTWTHLIIQHILI